MALPNTGPLSMSQVNTELGRSSSANISLNEAAVRALAGVPSGAISFQDLRGKSAFSVTADDVGNSGVTIAPDTAFSTSPNTTPVGGTAPYTYSWAYVSGDASITLNSAGIQNPTWERFFAVGDSVAAVWRVTATDANSNTATDDINVTLTAI
jgi:hypothetical protein